MLKISSVHIFIYRFQFSLALVTDILYMINETSSFTLPTTLKVIALNNKF